MPGTNCMRPGGRPVIWIASFRCRAATLKLSKLHGRQADRGRGERPSSCAAKSCCGGISATAWPLVSTGVSRAQSFGPASSFTGSSGYLPPAWTGWPIVRPPVDRVGSQSRTAHHQALKKLLLCEFIGLAYIDSSARGASCVWFDVGRDGRSQRRAAQPRALS